MSQQQRDTSVTLKAADNQLYVIVLSLSNSAPLYQTAMHFDLVESKFVLNFYIL